MPQLDLNSLPQAPRSLDFGNVRIVFDCMTDGDEERGFAPGYRFRIMNDKAEEVGHLSYRVGDSDHVRLAAGHIGYEVLEPHRGHGYAAEACLALAPFISEVSGSVLITTDPDNLASIKTIKCIGATYLDEVDVPVNDPHFQRGSKRKKRYLWRPMRITSRTIT